MRVGFIGLGTMGSSMALNLRTADYDMIVNDIRRETSAPHLQAGAGWASSAREVAETADIVFTSLPGPREVEQVALAEDGLLGGMRRGTAWFDLSTNSPTVVRRLHDLFAAKGVALLDSPSSCGPPGAKARKLGVWNRRRGAGVQPPQAGARRFWRSGYVRRSDWCRHGGEARTQHRGLRDTHCARRSVYSRSQSRSRTSSTVASDPPGGVRPQKNLRPPRRAVFASYIRPLRVRPEARSQRHHLGDRARSRVKCSATHRLARA